MGYGRRYNGRGGYQRQNTGRIGKANSRPGPCRYCGLEIPAGAGQLWREETGAWTVVHRPQEWTGSPVSGQYTGGCPDETDRLNAEGRFGGESGARSEHDAITFRASIHAARTPEPARSYARTAPRYERCTHEDYPCCGCGE